MPRREYKRSEKSQDRKIAPSYSVVRPTTQLLVRSSLGMHVAGFEIECWFDTVLFLHGGIRSTVVTHRHFLLHQFSASHRCAVVMSQIGKAKLDGVNGGRGYNRISTLDTDTDTDTSEVSIDLCHSQVTRKGAVEMVM